MLNILKKIADWIVEHEMSEAESCSIPDEIIDEWLETIEERKKLMEEHKKTNTAQYEMLLDLDKKVKKVEAIRKEKCKIAKK